MAGPLLSLPVYESTTLASNPGPLYGQGKLGGIMCNCVRHVHSFACYLRNIATDANAAAMGNGISTNAR